MAPVPISHGKVVLGNDAEVITEAICAVRKRQAKPLCRLVMDESYYRREHEMKNRHQRLMKLQRCSVEIRLWSTRGEEWSNLHRKTIQSDGNPFLLGSANGSDRTLQNEEIVTWLNLSSREAEIETARFEHIWEESKAL